MDNVDLPDRRHDGVFIKADFFHADHHDASSDRENIKQRDSESGDYGNEREFFVLLGERDDCDDLQSDKSEGRFPNRAEIPAEILLDKKRPDIINVAEEKHDDVEYYASGQGEKPVYFKQTGDVRNPLRGPVAANGESEEEDKPFRRF